MSNPRPVTVFDAPQFNLIPDTGERQYANVSNVLSLLEEGREEPRKFNVVVPTSLFTLMKQVFKISPLDPAFLYLVQEGEYWVLGLAWGLEGYADLWVYTDAGLPSWLK